MTFSARCKIVGKRLLHRTVKFFNETNLHGFRFITDPSSSKFKSYFWGFVCLVCTCLCLFLTHSQFRAYYSNRITTTILTTAFPAWEVPFPAVTICNFNVVYKDNTKKFRDLLKDNYNSNAIDNFFSNLSQLVLSQQMEKETNWAEHYPIVRALERAGYNSEKLMSELAHPCDEMISDCYWNNQETNCSQAFQQVKTSNGFCCSFNYRRTNSFSDEIFVRGVGRSYGLYLHLNVQEEQYVSPLKHSMGIEVSVHENIHYPDMSTYSSTIRSGNDVSLSVKPEITESGNSVKTIDRETRGCVFSEEVTMHWASRYSYSTCMNRCKAKLIQTYCHCIPYYYYAVKRRPRYCSFSDMACITRNSHLLKNPRSSSNFITGNAVYKAESDSQHCQCYPQCNEISYSYQLDQEHLRQSDDLDTPANRSILRVYFGHVSCTKLLRSVFITWELILASVGGLIGLCLGGSIMSVIEIVYHILESLFSRYGKESVKRIEKKKYKPKLYLSDFAGAKVAMKKVAPQRGPHYRSH